MRLVYLATFTVDASFNVTGVAYKVRERSRVGDVDFPRDKLARSNIAGSLIGTRALLNWETEDHAGRKSLQTMEVDAIATDRGVLRGRFFSDVAAQVGTLCARKVDFKMFERLLPERICAPE